MYDIDVAQIAPAERNPRHKFHALDELAGSLQEYGLLQPLVVRRVDGGYRVIAGHRRLAAAKQLGWTKIAAVVRDETDDQAYLLTLTENLAREDLTPAEEAAGLADLIRETGWSVRQVAKAIHKSHAYLSQRLRVFENRDLKKPVLKQQLSISAAEELLRVAPEQRGELVKQAVREHWTPAQARAARLSAKAKWLDSNHLQSASSEDLEQRIQALARDLVSLQAADLSPGARRRAQELFEVLQRLVKKSTSRRT